MKANANFKLSKTSKMMIASMLPERSHIFKNAMIAARPKLIPIPITYSIF